MSRKHQNICPDCGAYLDPGERCDCQQAAQEAEKGHLHKHIMPHMGKPIKKRPEAVPEQRSIDTITSRNMRA